MGRCIVLSVLGICASTLAGVAVPDPAAQKEAEKVIRQLFKDDYAKFKPEDKAELAHKLAQLAPDTHESATRYVLWREAATLAAQGGNWEAAIAQIDTLAREYNVDATALKREALESALRISRKAETSRAIKAMQTLLAKPTDPAANLTLGLYTISQNDDWTKGLSFLSACSDPTLKAAAEQDAKQPTEPVLQAAVGDSWWTASEKQPEPVKTQFRARAVHWYKKSLPGLNGLAKLKVEKRISAVDLAVVETAKKSKDSARRAYQRLLDALQVTSAGWDCGNHVSIIFLDKPILKGGLRGLSVAALSRDGNVLLKQTFDTFAHQDAADQFAQAIAKLPDGTLVILAVADEATVKFNATGQAAIRSIGGEIGLLHKPFRSSYICIGVKGFAPGNALFEAIAPTKLTYPPPADPAK